MAEQTAPQGTGTYEGQLSSFCPRFHVAVELIGRRWSGAILRVMLSGQTRYSDIACAIPGLSDRLLSERLKEFEAEGILKRHVIPETPVRIEYHLTEKGEALHESFAVLAAWAENWVEYDPDRHAAVVGLAAGKIDGSC